MIKKNWKTILLLIVVIILAVALFKGCQKSKSDAGINQKLIATNDSLLALTRATKVLWDESKRRYQDTIDIERGQRELAQAQKDRTECELDAINNRVNNLLANHYKAAGTVSPVSNDLPYNRDCDTCFSLLKEQNLLTNRYRSDINLLQTKWDKQNATYESRFKELEAERLSFLNKIGALTEQNKREVAKLQPRNKLYLSWGVMWGPLPRYAGAGLLYMTKRGPIYGVKCYYGSQGYLVETTMNFPLSLRFGK